MYVNLNLTKKGNNSHLPRIKLKLSCNCRGLHKSIRQLAVKVNVNRILLSSATWTRQLWGANATEPVSKPTQPWRTNSWCGKKKRIFVASTQSRRESREWRRASEDHAEPFYKSVPHQRLRIIAQYSIHFGLAFLDEHLAACLGHLKKLL